LVLDRSFLGSQRRFPRSCRKGIICVGFLRRLGHFIGPVTFSARSNITQCGSLG
jgi:hypothetical protein